MFTVDNNDDDVTTDYNVVDDDNDDINSHTGWLFKTGWYEYNIFDNDVWTLHKMQKSYELILSTELRSSTDLIWFDNIKYKIKNRICL